MTGEGVSSSVVPYSVSSPLITPFNASNRPVIRGDRLGEVGGPELDTERGEVQSSFSVAAEEGRWIEDFGTLTLTWWRNEQESENRHLPWE